MELEKRFNEIAARLLEVVRGTGARHEGNCLTQDGTLRVLPELERKRRNLATLGAAARDILEIGFNSGFSAVVLLLASEGTEGSSVTAIDLCEHPYTAPCGETVAATFPGRFRLIPGSSTDRMPEQPSASYDLVHVDGSHDLAIAAQDLVQADRVVRPGGVVLFDDTQDPQLSSLFTHFIREHGYTEVSLEPTIYYQHRAARKPAKL